MATVSKRDKSTDSKYSKVLGDKPSLSDREPDIGDVIEDLRDDVNSLCDLANLVDGFRFTYTAPSGKARAKLTISHTSSGKNFIIEAAN